MKCRRRVRAGLAPALGNVALKKTCSILRGSKSRRLAIKNFDGIIQACQLEDVLVMVAESVGEHSLFLAIDADEQRDDQADAATVHIF